MKYDATLVNTDVLAQIVAGLAIPKQCVSGLSHDICQFTFIMFAYISVKKLSA